MAKKKKSVSEETTEPKKVKKAKVVEEETKTEESTETTESTTEEKLEPVSEIVEPVVETVAVEQETAALPSIEDFPKLEPVIEPVVKAEDGTICTYNRGINNYFVFALDTLNTCSIKETDKIIRARLTIYENFFNGVASAPTDAESYTFIKNVLDAISKRPYVSDSSRAFVGFMRLSTITRQQANLYQMVWKALTECANPETRTRNVNNINWRLLTPAMAYHKKGEIINRRFRAFFLRYI